MGEMGGNGGKWGGNGEVAGIAQGMWVVEGCCGMWLRGRGGKWEKNATKYSFFIVPFSPFFRRSKIFPIIPFVRIGSRHSPTEKWEFSALINTHRHNA